MLKIVSGAALLVALMTSTVNAQSVLFELKVNGAFSNGRSVSGKINAYSDGIGRFEVRTAKGFRCRGTYATSDTRLQLIVPVECSRNVRGTVYVNRNPGLMSGSATVQLSNGTSGTFNFTP